MKQLYRIITTLFLTFMVIGVSYAQSENTGIIARVHVDTCASFKNGCQHYEKGRDHYINGSFDKCESELNNAILCFERHMREHPENTNTSSMLGYSYYMLFHICNTENIKECLEKALLYLPTVDTIARFEMHYCYGQYLYLGDSLLRIEPDYCKALIEYNKAIDYCSREILSDTVLFDLYKSALYARTIIYLRSYYNSKFERIFKRVGISVWDTCIGGQQIEHCIEDMNRVIDISLPDVDTLALGLLGQCYFEKKDCKKAENYCKESGFTLSPPIDWLDESFIESWRNDYNLYHHMYSDKKDGDNTIDGWENWAHLIMWYYINKKEYKKALDFWFKIKNNFSFSYKLLCDQSLCRIYLGDFSATTDMAFAYRMMNEQPSGSASECSVDPLNAINYLLHLLARTMIYNEQDYELARDYYLNPDSTFTSDDLLILAICNRKLAEQEIDPDTKTELNNSATRTFREVIAMEDSVGHFSSAPYAYYFLDEYDNAVRTMEYILQKELPTSTLNLDDSLTCYILHYTAAEIFAKVGEVELAEQHIKIAFEFIHNPILLAFALKAPLLDPIQEKVQILVEQYKEKLGISERPIHSCPIVCDIPFKKREIGYTRTISCIISEDNDTLINNMLFDPGADYVLITPEIAKAIGITDNDIIGTQGFQLANGSVGRGKLVSLKEVRLGNITLENVQAIIDESNNAQPLLGCTVINNLKVEMPSPVNKGMIRLIYIKESIEIPERK